MILLRVFGRRWCSGFLQYIDRDVAFEFVNGAAAWEAFS